MGNKKQKYYVVWQGTVPGIYNCWEDCLKQVKGIAGARYKSFETLAEAQEAYQKGPSPIVPGERKSASADNKLLYIDADGMTAFTPLAKTYNGPLPDLNSLAVDAACSGNPGVMEYQGVHILTRQQMFHYKAPVGTNNIGEFLGIVHGLSYLKKHNINCPIYSDSANAISWVNQKLCKSKLAVTAQTAELWDYVHRAEAWLHNNTWDTEIRKWDTEHWGEIPADFGRK